MPAAPRRSARLTAAALGFLLLWAGGQPSAASSAEQAGHFISEMTDAAIERLTDDSVPAAQREERFRELFRANFDIRAIGRFVLARYWRAADETEQQQFLEVFEDVMVRRFAPQFSGYAGTGLQVTKVQPLNESGQFMVTTRIEPPNGEPFAVDWRVRHSNDDFKVLDVIGEGISMALTLRSEYTSVIKSNGGVGALIEQLRRQVESGGGA